MTAGILQRSYALVMRSIMSAQDARGPNEMSYSAASSCITGSARVG